MRFAPAALNRSATSLAVIGSRPVGLAVLAGVAVEGAHRRDALGRRALGGVDHDQLLHDRVVDRHLGAAGVRLHDEDVAAADRLAEAAVDLAVRELARGSARRAARRGARRSPRRAPGATRPEYRTSCFLVTSSIGPPARPTRLRFVARRCSVERPGARARGYSRAGSSTANGPTTASSPISASRPTVFATTAPAPTTQSTSRACGPISRAGADDRAPLQDRAGEQRDVGAQSSTVAST